MGILSRSGITRNASTRKGASAYLFGSVLSFGIEGDADSASKVVDSLKLASHLANVGKL